MTGHINLTIKDIDHFCRMANTIDADVNIGSGNRIFDAKSLISLLNLDMNVSNKIVLLSDNEEDIKKFKELLRIYGGTIE